MKGLVLLKATIFGILLLCSQVSTAQDLLEKPELAHELEIVNVNQADAETIASTLKGIGISRAEAIVAYREENGIFSSLDDLSGVKGVGEVTLRNNEDKIVFE